MRDVVLSLYRIARSRNWKPWELQTELRKVYEGVIAVGDDLSFTLKLDREVSGDLEVLGGMKTRIYPYKKAYRFEKGYVAFEGKFLRVSREIDEKLLVKILETILPED